jgi:hypothetical protein
MSRLLGLPVLGAMLIVALSPAVALAHVSWGILVDRQGNVYVADVVAGVIWRLDRQGRLNQVVSGVHSHGIALDQTGRLYGEDARFVGGKFMVTLWRRASDGVFEQLASIATNPPAENIIVLDQLGRRYYWNGNLNVRGRSEIVRRSLSGESTVLAGSTWGHRDGRGAEAMFETIGALAWGPDSALYVTEGGRGAVRRIGSDRRSSSRNRAGCGHQAVWPSASMASSYWSTREMLWTF